MKILFITHFYTPHIGGVEKHTAKIAHGLQKMGNKVTILTEKHSKNLRNWEIIDGVKVVRFSYPHIKFLGLIFIWIELFKNRKLIEDVDIVHIHDVFIWYLPFHYLQPTKKVFTTFHGWEGVWPIPKRNIYFKKLASKFSLGTIAVGKFIEKYYCVKSDIVMYGGADFNLGQKKLEKLKDSIVYIGRLEKDTGLTKFLGQLGESTYTQIQFIGDGGMWKECEKYGKVHGFCDPTDFLKSAEYVVPGGYLSYIEAITYKCKIIVYPDNPLKKDYWSEIVKIKTFPSWNKLAGDYLALYKFSDDHGK